MSSLWCGRQFPLCASQATFSFTSSDSSSGLLRNVEICISAAEVVDAINVISSFYMRFFAFLCLIRGGSLLPLATKCIFSSAAGHHGGFSGRLVLPEPLVLM